MYMSIVPMKNISRNALKEEGKLRFHNLSDLAGLESLESVVGVMACDI